MNKKIKKIDGSFITCEDGEYFIEEEIKKYSREKTSLICIGECIYRSGKCRKINNRTYGDFSKLILSNEIYDFYIGYSGLNFIQHICIESKELKKSQKSKASKRKPRRSWFDIN